MITRGKTKPITYSKNSSDGDVLLQLAAKPSAVQLIAVALARV